VLQHIGIYHENEGGETAPPDPESIVYPTNVHMAHIVGEGGTENKSGIEPPVVFRDFAGYNDNQYTPPDNSVAVSDDGIIVSAMNSNLRIYKPTGQITKLASFHDLFLSLYPSQKQAYFDPRVIYDSESGHFIVVVLVGNLADSSRIMILFSKTTNPLDGWNSYALSGNVLNKNQWTDYPNVAISDKELFISGNLFTNSQAFQEPFILQIGLQEGYDAATLQYRKWGNLRHSNGEAAFTIVPVPNGLSGNYTPGMNFVANQLGGGKLVTLFQLNGDRNSSGLSMTSTTLTYSGFTYYSPSYSPQKGNTDYLNAGDCRIKQAFYLNGIIHYVFAAQSSTNTGLIVYCRLNVQSKTLDSRFLSLAGSYLSYPGLASLATISNPTDKTVLIAYLRSSSLVYPEIDAITCDDAGNFSDAVVVEAGKSGVNILSDHIERWGDYIGVCRKYSTNSCLVTGAYGSGGSWQTRIDEIGLNSDKVGIEEQTANTSEGMDLYPNPVQDRFNLKFNLRQEGPLNISLYDMQGRIVDVLYNGVEMEGEKSFSFNKEGLATGVYTLRITADKDRVSTKKIVVK
jgi:hypothetical protein